jgi:NAD(P)H-dependent flavin oxidoreductase YrpB (nitropropane dioxygenase family)
MFKTRITEMFGIEYPILAGAMQWLSRAELVAAVANAGGLGFIASATFDTPEDLEAEIRRARELTDKPIGVNLNLFPSARPQQVEEMAQVTAEQKIPVVETSGHEPPDRLMPTLRAGKVTVMHKCARVRDARSAERAGVDAICIVGTECGGHPSMEEIGGSVLIPATVDAVSVPVVAAGGFADGRGLLAALALGAEGILMGTRFMLTTECILHENVKQRLLQARENETVMIQKSVQNPSRVLRNTVAEQVVAMEARGATLDDLMPLISGLHGRSLMQDGDLEAGTIACSQGVGLMHEVKPVREVIADIMRQAAERAKVFS